MAMFLLFVLEKSMCCLDLLMVSCRNLFQIDGEDFCFAFLK